MPLTIDSSFLRSATRCDTQAVLQYGLGRQVPGDRPKLDLGHAFHVAKAVLFRTDSPEGAMHAFDSAYRSIGERLDPGGPLAAYHYANARAVVQHWMTTFQPSKGRLPYEVRPDLVEIPFDLPLTDDGEIRMVGRMDGLVIWNGMWCVDETKTTGQDVDGDWKDQWYLDGQLTAYLWAARQLHQQGQLSGDVEAITGAVIDAVQIRKLNFSQSKCRTHGVPYFECRLQEPHIKVRTWGPFDRAEEQLEQWRRDAVREARRMEAVLQGVQGLDDLHQVSMQGAMDAGGACRFCQFAGFCRRGRDPLEIEQGTVVQWWDPLKEG